MQVKNRIIKTELVSWRTLKELQPKGFKELSKANYEKLKQSILNNNFAMAFTVWQSKNDIFIIDGHHRYKVLDLLESEGVEVPEKLPCTFIDCKDKKEASKLVLMYSSIYAKVQEEGLYEFLNIEGLDFETVKTEFDIPDIDFEKFELGYFKEQDEEKLNDVPELTEKAVSKLGDIFVIDGKHRVMCGDSTKADDVGKLMDGRKADMVFIDPPYGVGYSKKAETLGRQGNSQIKNDDNIESAKKIWDLAFKNISEILDNGSAYYVCAPQGGDQMMMMMMSNTMPCKHELIWVKDSPVFSMGRLDYDYQHEPILYGWKGSHKFFAKGEHIKSIWHIKRPKESKLHPTMKPVELICNAIKNSTQGSNNIVTDLFLGSGSTLIACEQTNRACYGMELDPIYIDVILKRYKKLYPECKIECLNRKFNVKYLD